MLMPENLSAEKRRWLEGLRQDLVFDAELRGQPLRFHTTWGLFSPREIDEGSRLLLDYVQIAPGHHSADLGCGYGPLGLTLARLAPEGRHSLLDKDFVAVRYAKRNAELNGLTNVDVVLSNGFDQLDDRRFHCLVSNLPAKTGKEQYYLYFYEALARLEPGGAFYVVTITGLRDFIKRSFKEVFGNYDKLKQGPKYTVAVAYKE